MSRLQNRRISARAVEAFSRLFEVTVQSVTLPRRIWVHYSAALPAGNIFNSSLSQLFWSCRASFNFLLFTYIPRDDIAKRDDAFQRQTGSKTAMAGPNDALRLAATISMSHPSIWTSPQNLNFELFNAEITVARTAESSSSMAFWHS